MNFTTFKSYQEYIATAPRLTKEQLCARRKSIEEYVIPDSSSSDEDSIEVGKLNDGYVLPLNISVKRPVQFSKTSKPATVNNGYNGGSSVDKHCVVCFSQDDDSSNRLICCQGACRCFIHVDCYGFSDNKSSISIPSLHSNFKCDGCLERLSTRNISSVSCYLCGNKDGLLKRSVCGKLCHTICVIFCYELTVQSGSADNLHCINRDRDDLLCLVCENKGGACVQCSFGNCLAAFHPYCAYKQEVLLLIREVVGGHSNDTINDNTIDSFHSESQSADSIHMTSSFLHQSQDGFEYELYCYDHQKYYMRFSTNRIVSSRPPFKQKISEIVNSPNTLTQAVLQDSDKQIYQHVDVATTREKKRKRLKKVGDMVHVESKKKSIGPYLRRSGDPSRASTSETVMGFFEHEAELSGDDSSGGDDVEDEESLNDTTDSFINDGDYTQYDSQEGAVTQAALYLRVNNQLNNKPGKRLNKKRADEGNEADSDEERTGLQQNITTPLSCSDDEDLFTFGFRGGERCAATLKQLVQNDEISVIDVEDSSMQSQSFLFTRPDNTQEATATSVLKGESSCDESNRDSEFLYDLDDDI